MTSEAVTIPPLDSGTVPAGAAREPHDAAGRAPDLGPRPSRSLLRQALADTIRPARAKIGLAWIGVIVFAGVFAPFIANSYPYLAKVDGRWSSPLLRNLTPVDVVLSIAALLALVLIFVPRRVRAFT